ncbi:hypothetical protein HUT06_39415 [Actinomadura sp. NAK00032]|uniref:hypothetical protein n=1 Tax=Actinomadura sp. NAK00032 TaxID=2742128 RepID=UPI00159011AB|nr:hypothetical protein [Actinomadura sp. NAK00032]QKW39359.1 hypothetical protein HUT06_39415 [Actinomadura sp. NAK00032]
MITLKAALIAASAVGTVAVGGGATWAMTGSHHEAGLQSNDAKAPTAVERKVQDAAPKTLPTCIPAKLSKAGAPAAGLPETGAKKQLEQQRKQVEQQLKQNPAGAKLPDTGVPAPGLPKGELPKGELPKTELPKTDLPGAKVPGAEVPADVKNKVPADVKGKVPANLPTCPPSTKDTPAGARSAPPAARVPAKPAAPAVPKLDCSTLKPAVKVGGAAEKAAMLTKGLRYASTVPGSAELREQRVCAVTQKWVGKAGQWVTVQTLKTPAGMSQAELRKTLKLPEGGTPVAVAGVAAWQSPKGGGVLLFDPNGYSMYLDGSPVLAGGLPDMATALRQAR